MPERDLLESFGGALCAGGAHGAVALSCSCSISARGIDAVASSRDWRGGSRHGLLAAWAGGKECAGRAVNVEGGGWHNDGSGEVNMVRESYVEELLRFYVENRVDIVMNEACCCCMYV